MFTSSEIFNPRLFMAAPNFTLLLDHSFYTQLPKVQPDISGIFGNFGTSSVLSFKVNITPKSYFTQLYNRSC